MKHHISITIVLLVLLIGCKKADEPQPFIRVGLELESMTIAVGETQTNRLINATDPQIVFAPDFVDARIDNDQLTVTGLRAGKDKIILNLGGQRIYCPIIVIMTDDPEQPGNTTTPETEQQIQEQLADRSERFTYNAITISYNTPGTLFTITNNRHTITLCSLSTGDIVTFTSSMPIPTADNSRTGDYTQLASPSLNINGTPHPLESAIIMKTEQGIIWLRLITDKHQVAWIVAGL